MNLYPENSSVPILNHMGDGGAAQNGQDEAEHRQAGGRCPAMSEQRGEVMACLSGESAADDDGPGQTGTENGRQDHQERDKAECEHGSKLQRAVYDSEL